MFLTESVSLIHIIASVGKVELEQTPFLKFVIQVNRFFQLLSSSDTSVLFITLLKKQSAGNVENSFPSVGNLCEVKIVVEIVPSKVPSDLRNRM